jgi:hypothetical protein
MTTRRADDYHVDPTATCSVTDLKLTLLSGRFCTLTLTEPFVGRMVVLAPIEDKAIVPFAAAVVPGTSHV